MDATINGSQSVAAEKNGHNNWNNSMITYFMP